MDISNPKRILVISREHEAHLLSQVVKDLTGTLPTPNPKTSSLAGTSHSLNFKTRYYTADVPIWIDLVSSPTEWADSFTSDEAREVLDVLGGIVVVFSSSSSPSSSYSSSLPTSSGSTSSTAPTPPSKKEEKLPEPGDLIRQVGRVMETLGGWNWDGVGLGICVGGGEDGGEGDRDEGVIDELDDACAGVGLEFVHAAVTTATTPPVETATPKTGAAKAGDGGDGGEKKNEFGEKIGISRALEALQSNDWNMGISPTSDDELDGMLDEVDASRKGQDGKEGEEDGLNDFGIDPRDMEALKKAIWGHDDDEPDNDNGNNDNKNGMGDGKTSVKGPTSTAAPAQRQSPQEQEGGEDFGNGDGDIDEVDKLERMMGKLLAVRDMSVGLPDEQKKRKARKAVGEVMREL